MGFAAGMGAEPVRNSNTRLVPLGVLPDNIQQRRLLGPSSN